MSHTESLATAVFGRVLVGLGVSTLFVSNFKLIAEWFDPRQFVVMGDLFMAMGGVGALLASVPLAWVSSLMGWRMTLAVDVCAVFDFRQSFAGLGSKSPGTKNGSDLLRGRTGVAGGVLSDAGNP